MNIARVLDRRLIDKTLNAHDRYPLKLLLTNLDARRVRSPAIFCTRPAFTQMVVRNGDKLQHDWACH